jgi:hypothetical protein
MPDTPAPSPTPMQRIFTATLIIGVPGSGKTTLYKGFSEYLWETYKRVLLLYSTDGGAIPTDVQKRMKQGLIRFWRMRTRSAPGLGLETMYLASKGYWPRYINAETGETSPAVQLVPPVTVSYAVSCQKGHPLSTVPAPSLIVPMFCTPCNAFVPQTELRVVETSIRTRGFEAIGGVGFDGLTSFTDGVLDHMDISRGQGDIGGEKAAFGGVVKSGSMSFGGNNRADVGFGQSRGHQFVNNSLSIPHLVEGPVWTALAMEATDEGGLPIVGPKLPGRAATDEASAWFGNVFETGKSPNPEGRSCFTLWLRPFTDPQNRRHLLKTGASPMGLPDLLQDPPPEAMQAYSVVNLGSVFKMLDEDLRRSLLEELPGAPGTPSGISEYGDALTVQTMPAAATVAQAASGIPPLMVPGKAAPAPAPQPAPPANTPASVATTAGSPTVAGGPVPAGAAAPAAPAPIPAPPSVGSAVAAAAPVANGTNGGPALMVAQPRQRRKPTTAAAPVMAAVDPTQTAPPAASAALDPVPQAVPPVATAASSGASAPPLMVPTSGTSAPPPPGMRPPMKVPGS